MSTGVAAGAHTRRHEAIGRRIRRVDLETGSVSNWALVTQIAPSPGGECWLVTLWDQEVDVWRIDAPGVRYEFA